MTTITGPAQTPIIRRYVAPTVARPVRVLAIAGTQRGDKSRWATGGERLVRLVLGRHVRLECAEMLAPR